MKFHSSCVCFPCTSTFMKPHRARKALSLTSGLFPKVLGSLEPCGAKAAKLALVKISLCLQNLRSRQLYLFIHSLNQPKHFLCLQCTKQRAGDYSSPVLSALEQRGLSKNLYTYFKVTTNTFRNGTQDRSASLLFQAPFKNNHRNICI